MLVVIAMHCLYQSTKSQKSRRLTDRSEEERELMLLLGEERGLAKLKTSSESFTK